MSRKFRLLIRHPLAGELTVVLAVKITLLILAGIFLFGADQRLNVDGKVMDQHLFNRNSPSMMR